MYYLIISLVVSANPAGANFDYGIEDYLSGYFETYRGKNNLIQDQSTSAKIFSISATGFGVDVWAIRVVEGKMKRSQTLARINLVLDFIEAKNPIKNRGWLYHFVDENGLPQSGSEVSTIDTAIFFWGARQAAKRLGDQELIKRVENDIAKIDSEWMIQNSPSKKLICHGLYWNKDKPIFIPYEWGNNSEGVLIYRLLGIPFKPVYDKVDLPLFVYYYPMCFLKEDEFLPSLKKAMAYQESSFGHAGITATNTEVGYQPYPREYISPLSLYAISAFDSSARDELKLRKLSPRVHSQNWKTGRQSAGRIGIDEGAAILLHHRL